MCEDLPGDEMKTLGLYHVKFIEDGCPKPLWFVNAWAIGNSQSPALGAFNAIESAGKRVGSLALNLIRLCMGFAFLTIFVTIFRCKPLPLDATFHHWFWLSISGVIGFTIGDFLLLSQSECSKILTT